MRYQFLRFPGGKVKAVTFSYDAGVVEDLRLADIFCKYNLKATFNINSNYMGKDPRRLPASVIREKIADLGHEIATHGADHLAPLKQRSIAGIRDTLECRLGLEKEFGGIIDWPYEIVK